jgi:hypothetical protein
MMGDCWVTERSEGQDVYRRSVGMMHFWAKASEGQKYLLGDKRKWCPGKEVTVKEVSSLVGKGNW